MAYPDYPVNRIIVNGVDITETYGLVLADGYTMTPPEPKTYLVEIPGGNGHLDLTESLLGDIAYSNRKQEFTFYVIGTTNFEKVKTDVSNFLHGKYFSYTLTMDPGYTYYGRFSITSHGHAAYSLGIVGSIAISIDAKPFKYKATKQYSVSAVGGNMFYFPSGRESVRPTVITDGFLKVIFNGKLIILGQGKWTINDMVFKSGDNEVYFNSYDIHNLSWGNLITNEVTWGRFKQSRLYEWYKSNGDFNIFDGAWEDYANTAWNDLTLVNWEDLIQMHVGVSENDRLIFIKYDWGDL